MISGLRFKRCDASDYEDQQFVSLGSVAEFGKKRSLAKDKIYVGTEDLLKDFGGVRLIRRDQCEGINFAKGDILLGNIRPYLKKMWLAKCDGVCSPDVLVIRSKGVNPAYLFSILSSNAFFQHIAEGYKGSKMPRGDRKQILEYSFYLHANVDEQQKIAAFFTALDEKISIAREKITCLQKINDRLVMDVMDGKIRFSMRDGKGFPDWKREKLGESFSVKMCKRIFKEETLDVGDVPFYKIGTFGSEPDSYITQEQFELYKTKYSYPSAGDTLISCSGTVGRCVVFDGSPSYFQDSNIVWLESKESNFLYDKGYLTAVLQNFTWNELSSSTIKRIYSKDLLRKEWCVPCIEEQRLISKFIFELNEKVALEDKKLSLLINIKKSFMQQMFV